MTTLLERLDAQLATCTDPLKRAELMAEKGGYLARMGQFDPARELISSVRSTEAVGASPRVAIQTFIAEAMIDYYDNFGEKSTDRLVRAHALACSFAVDDLKLLAAAWLAHIFFNRSDYSIAFRFLTESMRSDSNPATPHFVRGAMLIADAAMFVNELTVGNSWYGRARNCAIQLGDVASISAIIYNRAAMSLAAARLARALGRGTDDEERFLSAQIQSAGAYDRAKNSAALSQLLLACHAGSLYLEKKWGMAREAYEGLLVKPQKSFGLRSDELILRLEYASCLLECECFAEARAVLALIDFDQFPALAVDDQLVFASEYVRILRKLSRNDALGEWERKAMHCRSTYIAEAKFVKSEISRWSNWPD